MAAPSPKLSIKRRLGLNSLQFLSKSCCFPFSHTQKQKRHILESFDDGLTSSGNLQSGEINDLVLGRGDSHRVRSHAVNSHEHNGSTCVVTFWIALHRTRLNIFGSFDDILFLNFPRESNLRRKNWPDGNFPSTCGRNFSG